MQTVHGEFELLAYRDLIHGQLHWVLMKGEPQADDPFLVRVHVQNLLSDVLGLVNSEYGLPLHIALQEIQKQGSGLVLILGTETDPNRLLHRLDQERHPANVDEQGDNKTAQELRAYGIGAQIIADLGVQQMRVLSAPKRFHALGGYGLEVVEYTEPETTDE